MAKIKDLVSVCTSLCNIKIASNQGYQERIENIIQELVKYLVSLVTVTLTGLVAGTARGL